MFLVNAIPAGSLERMRRWFALPKASRLPRKSHQRALLLALLIFLSASSVRLLHWQDLRSDIESGRMRFGMSDLYKANAQSLLSGRFDLFIKGPNPPSDADILMHPPGYSLWLAFIFKLFGDSNTAWRLTQLLLDALTAVSIFLLARELLPTSAAFIAGMLIAISPQLAHTSLVLLPESLSVLPVVWAVFLIVRSFKSPNLFLTAGAGVLIGISCWLRPNALLLSPFLGLFIFLLCPRRRWNHAAALVLGTLAVIAPITLRNVVVFHTVTPLSLGAGVTLYEGIADYDDENQFGFLSKDHLLTEWEARIYQRPDYARSLYGSDGVFRERERLKRGLDVVKKHPAWFLSVTLRRILFMMTYEPTPIVSRVPTVTHSLAATSHLSAMWTASPAQIVADAQVSPHSSTVELSEDRQGLLIRGLEGKPLVLSQAIQLNTGRDYVLQFPIDMLEAGRITIRVTGINSRTLFASAAMPDALQRFSHEKPTNILRIPFVSSEEQIRIEISGADNTNPVSVRLGRMQLFELGESSYTWTRAPRLVLRALQKFFTTASMLPLVLVGFVVLLMNSSGRLLAILLAVPLYYLLAQAPLHTEYRYVIAIHYFLLILAAVPLYLASLKLWYGANELVRRRSRR